MGRPGERLTSLERMTPRQGPIEIQEFIRKRNGIMEEEKHPLKSLTLQGNAVTTLGLIGAALEMVGQLPLGHAGLIIGSAGVIISTIGRLRAKKRLRVRRKPQTPI